MDLTVYPVNDFGPAMKGLVIGGLGIFHVFVAQFAIGGGMLMCYLQWLAQTGRCAPARVFLNSYFKFLVLVSFVIGALTGVAMWFTSIQVSPRTIGMMVDEFHWIWAIEWTFFALEVVAGYAFYRYGERLPDRARMGLLVLYSVAAFFSLFWINGILSWQLTPGGWSEDRSVWSGFFNPSFWPSLIYRTIAALTIAALVACAVINTLGPLAQTARKDLIQRIALLLVPIALMPFIGAWYLLVLPSDSRSWLLGGSPTMSLFLAVSVGASFLIGGYALIGMVWQKLYINGATATLLCALAGGATAGGEFIREGARKPYTVRGALYSNSLTPDDVKHLREVGATYYDRYPMVDPEQYPNEQVLLGAKVNRMLCSVCHTVDGSNGLLHLTNSWTINQRRINIAKLQYTKAYMPPFAGTRADVEAIVQWLTWLRAERPAEWPISDDPEVLLQIGRWLDEAGVERAPVGPTSETLP